MPSVTAIFLEGRRARVACIERRVESVGQCSHYQETTDPALVLVDRSSELRMTRVASLTLARSVTKPVVITLKGTVEHVAKTISELNIAASEHVPGSLHHGLQVHQHERS